MSWNRLTRQSCWSRQQGFFFFYFLFVTFSRSGFQVDTLYVFTDLVFASGTVWTVVTFERFFGAMHGSQMSFKLVFPPKSCVTKVAKMWLFFEMHIANMST
eukprot:12625.XXX_657332_657634_1 [CDS] Oithona nana genome sequencing.